MVNRTAAVKRVAAVNRNRPLATCANGDTKMFESRGDTARLIHGTVHSRKIVGKCHGKSEHIGTVITGIGRCTCTYYSIVYI